MPGNHDYLNNPGAGPYFAYFGANAGPPARVGTATSPARGASTP